MREGLVRLLSRLDIDRAVFFGILSKLWTMAAGPVTALLIATRFTPEYQGYYYTFASLLALQVFVELGLGAVVIQFASHEWSRLGMDREGFVVGDDQALSRLRSLSDIVLKWYFFGGLILALGLGAGGYVFFSSSRPAQVDWVMPWLTLCALTGISIWLTPLWALLEGCNQVAAVYTYRFVQGFLSVLAVWCAIGLGANLWVASIGIGVTLLCAAVFLGRKYAGFIKSVVLAAATGPRMDWRREILPMQWRIALSWISGYFVFSLFTPVIFRYHGAVAAGQFGMTWSVVGVIAMVAGAWLPPKVPIFGMLIAKKDFEGLDALFARVVKIFIVITALSAWVVWLAIYALNRTDHPIAARLLPVVPMTVFLIAQVIMGLSMPFSAYLRAHKKEPLMYVSLACGILTALMTFVCGKYFSVTAIGTGYLMINIVIVPVIVLIWRRCRREWHDVSFG